MKPICTVMVGLPASGKSTRVADMLKMDPDAFVYSTDNILERIAENLGKTYNDVFQEHIGAAKQEADSAKDDAINRGVNIIWDQTNLGVKKRRSIIDRMKKAGYAVECECFVLPTEVDDVMEYRRRLNGRPGKDIPFDVIESMVNSYVVPTVSEGFDCVIHRDMYGKITDSEDAFDHTYGGGTPDQ